MRAREVAAAGARWSEVRICTSDAETANFLLAAPSTPTVLLDRNDPSIATPATGVTLQARYSKPYLAHAAIGPSCAVARSEGGRMEIWTHSQSIYPLRHELARVLQIPLEAVTVHHRDGAGCYGHNGADDAALDAALLARAVPGFPVHLQRMRDDEFLWEPYGPAMVVGVNAEVGADGRVVRWDLDVWGNGHLSRPGAGNVGSSTLAAAWSLARPLPRTPQQDPAMGPDGISHGGLGRNAVALYDFPCQKVVLHNVQQVALRSSSLRALGAYANVFAIESFVDELAAAAQRDPVEFRLANLVDVRARAVLERVALMANWEPGKPGDGMQGRGVALAQYSNHMGYFAAVVEIGVDPDLHVQRVFAAADVGRVVNSDGVLNQVEGGIVQAISWTLKEQLRFGAHGVDSRGWPDYPILTFPEVPEITVELIDMPQSPSLGAGEITMGPVAAAIANALFHALGVRIRDLPITRDRLLSAM